MHPTKEVEDKIAAKNYCTAGWRTLVRYPRGVILSERDTGTKEVKAFDAKVVKGNEIDPKENLIPQMLLDIEDLGADTAFTKTK